MQIRNIKMISRAKIVRFKLFLCSLIPSTKEATLTLYITKKTSIKCSFEWIPIQKVTVTITILSNIYSNQRVKCNHTGIYRFRIVNNSKKKSN